MERATINWVGGCLLLRRFQLERGRHRSRTFRVPWLGLHKRDLSQIVPDPLILLSSDPSADSCNNTLLQFQSEHNTFDILAAFCSVTVSIRSSEYYTAYLQFP